MLFLALAAVFLFLRFWQARDVFDLSLAPLCSLGQRMAVQYDLSYEDRLVLMDVDSTHAILKSIDPDMFPAAPSFYDAARDNEFVSVSGFLYVYPDWMSFLPTEILKILRNGIYAQYCPFNKLLYLSEDCTELGLDYMYGLCISNIPPSIMGIDVETLRRRIQNKGDMSDNWKYTGYHQDH